MFLGERLLRDGIISAEQLKAALDNQAYFGGRLGTNLVEMGAIDLERLTQALAAHHGVPAATLEHFERIDPAILRKIPVALAQKHMAVPLGIESSGRTLAVAFVDPFDPMAEQELSFAAGLRVKPWVAPEARLLSYLEKLYGVSRGRRFVSVGAPESIAPPPTEVAAAGAPAPKAKAADDELRIGDLMAAPIASWESSIAATAPEPPAPEVELEAALLDDSASMSAFIIAQVTTQLAQATSREQVADVLMEFLRARFGAGLVFIVRENLALGWRGFSTGVGERIPGFEAVMLPLAAMPLLQAAFERGTLVRGSPQQGPLDRRLWKMMMTPPPHDAVVAPLVVGGRVVALIYAQSSDGAPLAPEPISELGIVCASAGTTFLRIIKSGRGSAAAGPAVTVR